MQRQFVLFATIGAISLVGGSQTAEWLRFSSSAENFTVSLPGEPKQESTASKSPLGNGHHIYTVESNKITYTISFSSFDKPIADAKDVKRILDFARDIVLITTSGSIASDKDITVEGYPGREVRIEQGKRLWIVRAYVVKDRMYQLMTTQSKAKDESPDTIKFYESFKLLSRPD